MARGPGDLALLAALALAPACVTAGNDPASSESVTGESDANPSGGDTTCGCTDEPDDPSCCPDGDSAASVAEAYVAASVFAAGRCNYGNCAKDGWNVDIAAGRVQVRCNYGNCLEDGWVAQFPGGSSASTTCNYIDCFKDGWRTSLPDGKSASTRCSQNDCPKEGWSTDIPGVGTATTRCAYLDCLKEGWTTDLPGGEQVNCRCYLRDCLTNGAICD